MASHSKSRWDNEEEDAALEAQRKREKEAKKRAKAERQRKLEQDAREREARVENDQANGFDDGGGGDSYRPAKRRRLSREPEDESPDGSDRSKQQRPAAQERTVLQFPAPEWGPCRHVDNFEKLNHIEEGSYGWVSRAKETATGEIVALKKLKMDNLNDGFPVTGLREIQTLMASRHGNIVKLREVVIGDKLEE